MHWPAFTDGKNSVLHIAAQTWLGGVPGLERLEFFDAIVRSRP